VDRPSVDIDEDSDFIVGLLDVADNLERALRYARDGDPLSEGVALTYQALRQVLRKADIVALDAVDQPFDPRWHEAVDLAPSLLPEGTVVSEAQRGYTLRGRLLRPARVTVSSGIAPDADVARGMGAAIRDPGE
jgi:molecular chaperone GrpE